MYIRRYLYALHKAMHEIPGIRVIGYFYWSLLDNYEWAEGYHMKFGLYEVNSSSFSFSRSLANTDH
jgi:beta-glucosidase